MFIIVI